MMQCEELRSFPLPLRSFPLPFIRVGVPVLTARKLRIRLR
jgi:hypothetical protein